MKESGKKSSDIVLPAEGSAKTRVQLKESSKSSATQLDKTEALDKTLVDMPENVDRTVLKQNTIVRKKPQAQNHRDENATRVKPVEDKTRVANPKSRENKTAGATLDDATRIKERTVSAEKTLFKKNIVKSDKTVGDINITAPEEISGQQTVANLRNTSSGKPILKDRFILEQVVGAGGMGVVYKATDLLKVEAKDREPYVAIKVLSDEFKAHPEAFVALQRESRKTQQIAHANIVNVFDFDRDSGTVFMTMEYMDGESLDKIIQQYQSTGLPTDDAWKILDGMSQALIHAHSQDIIHSDFKPGNVFITMKNTAKVFDFGIARAVANADSLGESIDDRTLFDAGTLGALTPAYASLEMLQGESPDIRDDIYALACVAYEMFTGEHPFNKVPADEAMRQKMKPKRITSISKKQWKTLEKALAFKREDRVESVSVFWRLMTSRYTPNYKISTALALLLAVGVAVYFSFFNEKTPQFSEDDIRNKLEYQIRLDLRKDAVKSLLAFPEFDQKWEEDIWLQISDLRKILPGTDAWLIQTEKDIFALYLKNITQFRNAADFVRAKVLIDHAYRYTKVDEQLETEKRLLADAIAEADKQRELEKQKKLQVVQPVKPRKPNKPIVSNVSSEQFKTALANVNQLLTCQSGINMRNLDTAVKKLQRLDNAQFKLVRGRIVAAVAACISRVAEAMPERATEMKKSALRMFGNDRAIAAINIIAKDPCDASLAGLGARGKRTRCKDKLSGSGSGPELVVIPARSGIKTFAIGKYEVTVAEINKFCSQSSVCQPAKNIDSSLPANNLSARTANAYLNWLSKKSGQKYRLPTLQEWVHAAKAKTTTLDPNRNCKLNSRGIEKGEQLVKARVGRQNSWGLVNYLGNVQEWVYDKGQKLKVVGASYQDNMDKCRTNYAVSHRGNADGKTGFRVLRQLKGR